MAERVESKALAIVLTVSIATDWLENTRGNPARLQALVCRQLEAGGLAFTDVEWEVVRDTLPASGHLQRQACFVMHSRRSLLKEF